MYTQATEDQDKVDEYLNVIEHRILAPIQDTEIQSYCTATLLLLFAAIDGLGKLLHPNDKAGPSDRIRCFLSYMGSDYGVRKRDLLNLRHSLVHNAINVASFLSHTELDADHHLNRMGAADFIYVNTRVMCKDFLDAFGRFRAEIKSDPGMMKRAADRLEWRSENTWNGLDASDMAIPSPPPPVEFIHAR